MTSLADIGVRAAAHELEVLGGFHLTPDDGLAADLRTLLLLGPTGSGFWTHLKASPEWQGGGSDPVDRWSRRVIGGLACDLGAKALFPFGGPPHHPFYQWALRTGRAFVSPVTLLVHDRAGLMVSFRGAIALRERLELPPSVPNPCATCATKPCLGACPPAALTAQGYDVTACHGFLDTPDGQPCLSRGCGVRRACPLSQAYGRLEEQSAYHMRLFHK